MLMITNFFSISRNGGSCIINWILSNVIEPYNFAHIDVYNFKNNFRINQDRKPVKQEDFYDASNLFFLLENASIKDYSYQGSDLNILVLRDFYNSYASFKQLLKNPLFFGLKNLDFKKLWLEYADQFIGGNHIDSNYLLINYNKWCVNLDYRRKIINNLKAAGLNIAALELEYNKVPTNGFGSSFDGFKFNGKANLMNTSIRYQYFIKDDDYIEVCSDPLVQENCLTIFGIDNIFDIKKVVNMEFSELDFQRIFDYSNSQGVRK